MDVTLDLLKADEYSFLTQSKFIEPVSLQATQLGIRDAPP